MTLVLLFFLVFGCAISGGLAFCLGNPKRELLSFLKKHDLNEPKRDFEYLETMIYAKVDTLIRETPNLYARRLGIETLLSTPGFLDGEWKNIFNSFLPSSRVSLKNLFLERDIRQSNSCKEIVKILDVKEYITGVKATGANTALPDVVSLTPVAIDNCVHFIFEKKSSKLALHDDVHAVLITKGYQQAFLLPDPSKQNSTPSAALFPAAVYRRTSWYEQDTALLSSSVDGHAFDELVMPHDGVVVTKLVKPLHSQSWVVYLDMDLSITQTIDGRLSIMLKNEG